MDFRKLTDKAKDLVDKRGGTDSLKEDAEELKSIASGKGSLSDKAKAAAAAIKEPGADEASAAGTPAAEATSAEAERAAEKVEGEERGKHGHGRGGRHGGGGGRGRQGGGGGGRQGGSGRGGRDGDPAV